MSHVFISYARSTEPQAHRIADALRTAGYEVWRDDEIPANRAYSEVIEERLTTAKAVVVVWSAEAAKSHWVRAEADKARDLFGKRFIVLPNAMYGTWESAIYNYQRLTDEQKAQQRINSLELP